MASGRPSVGSSLNNFTRTTLPAPLQPGCGSLCRRVESLPRRIRIRAVASEQLLQFRNLSRLNQVRIETCGEARVADVRARIATEGDQAELCRGKPLAETTPHLDPVHPRH